MNDYTCLTLAVEPFSETATDILAALLADVGYESFVTDETSSTLKAYIPVSKYNEFDTADILIKFPLTDTVITTFTETIEGEDWNHEWERHYFQPIVVGDNECVIHSSFHTAYPTCTYEIVIDPKMAFGTGHHATTSLIIGQLLRFPLQDKSVVDMGTGTGILALLAAMRGASPVAAIEIDEFAYTNAIENLKINGHPEINLMHGDAALLEGMKEVDLFIANINRNIIASDIEAYARTLRDGGTMLLSGFYESDIPVIMEKAAPLGLAETGHTVKGDNWTCLRLQKTSTPTADA